MFSSCNKKWHKDADYMHLLFNIVQLLTILVVEEGEKELKLSYAAFGNENWYN